MRIYLHGDPSVWARGMLKAVEAAEDAQDSLACARTVEFAALDYSGPVRAQLLRAAAKLRRMAGESEADIAAHQATL